jgi:hypothetical protein
MVRLRLGRRFGVALFLCALFATPAQGKSATLQVAPADHRGEVIAGEEPVAAAVVPFPRGRVSTPTPLGVIWKGRRPRGAPRECVPRASVFVLATAAPIALKRRDFDGAPRRRRTTITLEGAGVAMPRRVPAEEVTGRATAPRTFVALVHVHLPDDLLPLYARREVYVVGADLSGLEIAQGCPAATTRRAGAALRAALRGTRLLLPASYAPPPPPQPTPTLDLTAGGGLLMAGIEKNDRTGTSVAAGGDVNGDGLADALVSAPRADPASRTDAGTVLVVFGRQAKGQLALASLAPEGFRIDGPVAHGGTLPGAGVGDLDGDGLGEIAVGVPAAGPRHAGAVYVVRGKRDGVTVDLTRRDDVLFVIHGATQCRRGMDGGGLGQEVAAAGDVNGDGLGDVAVLDPDHCGDGRATGGVYIVFGKPSAGDVDLRGLGAGGIIARADRDRELSVAQIAGAGDVNGDGLADVIVGGAGYDDSFRDSPYAAVILGRRAGGATRLSRLPFRITSATCMDIGDSVAGAGDVNGDGFADVLIGNAEGCGDDVSRAFVVFGGPGPGRLDLDRLGTRGFAILGTANFNPAGAVAAAGDVNGDGLADLAFGDGDYEAGRYRRGAVVLVYGQRTTESVSLGSLGAAGFRWLGPGTNNELGLSLAGVGDFDGDGRPDLLAGLPGRASAAGGAWLLPVP